MTRRTLLYKEHIALKAKMVAFAGWEMPVVYSGVIPEHLAVREKVGLFDVGHMCVLEITVPQPELLVFESKWLTRKMSDMEVGRVRYNRILNARQGVVDDILAYAFEDKYWWVVNASNADKVMDYLEELQFPYDNTPFSAIALQGPRAEELLSKYVEVKDLKYYRHKTVRLLDQLAVVSRTGYTGEDGFEIYTDDPVDLWKELLKQGSTPCGLGARDTLRIEAAMPLYGHELSDDITQEQSQSLVGIEMLDKAIPRENYQVFTNEKKIGYITSGTYSPTLSKPIGLAYLQGVKEGSIVEVEVREKLHSAKVVKLPFYKR